MDKEKLIKKNKDTMMINEIKNILVLVELNNGEVRQVLTTKDKKNIALKVMENDKIGKVVLSEKLESIELEFAKAE